MNTLSPISGRIRIDVSTTPLQLQSLEPEWTELWQRCPRATPFQSPAWLIPWWKHLGHGELWVLAVRRENQLVALGPFFKFRKGRISQLQLLGTGVSDYLDLLALPEYESEAAAAIIDSLNTAQCDLCDWHELRADSPLLRAAPPEGWQCETVVQEVCPILSLPAEKEKLAEFVPEHTLQKLDYYRRHAAKIGPLQFERADQRNFSELFESFLRLHTARWRFRGKGGALAQTQLRNFHRETAEQFLGQGLLRLYGLRLNGQIVATLYAFGHAYRMFNYLSGFAPEFRNLSLGTILIGYAIEAAIDEQVREFDFLRGSEPYKYTWGAKNRPNYRRRLFLNAAFSQADARAPRQESRR